MDQLFFGERRTTRSPRRTTRSPRRTTRSPRRRTRKTEMCDKKLSLSKLRKLANENGINIYSEAKTAINKRTGMPKKSKMVGCSTLKKRLNEAGLGYLYKTRSVNVKMDPSNLFEDNDTMSTDGPVMIPNTKNLIVDDDTMSSDGPVMVPTKKVKSSPMPISVMMQADPACASEFQKLAEKQPNNRAQAKFLKEYKGYAMGQGPCDKRQLVPVHMHGIEDDLDDYADVADFNMSYGYKHVLAGRRPKKIFKHVGSILVKGRSHHVYKGKEGGLFYMKGKTGNKIYIDKERLKKNRK